MRDTTTRPTAPNCASCGTDLFAPAANSHAGARCPECRGLEAGATPTANPMDNPFKDEHLGGHGLGEEVSRVQEQVSELADEVSNDFRDEDDKWAALADRLSEVSEVYEDEPSERAHDSEQGLAAATAPPSSEPSPSPWRPSGVAPKPSDQPKAASKESHPAPAVPEQESQPKRESRSTTAGITGIKRVAGLVGVVALAATGLLTYREFTAAPPAVDEVDEPTLAREAPSPSTVDLRQAIATGRGIVHGAAHTTLDEPEQLEVVAGRFAEEDRHSKAGQLYEAVWSVPARRTSELAEAYLEVLERTGDHARARAVAVEAYEQWQSQRFADAFRASIRQDASLRPDEVVLDDPTRWRAGRPAPEFSERGFLLTDRHGTRFLFAPASSWQNQWRDDIAAWTLCELIGCSFEVPRTRPARMTRSTYRTLVEETGPESESALRGSLRRLPDAPVRWPIERYEIWRPWLQAGAPLHDLERPLADALAPLKSEPKASESNNTGPFDQTVLEVPDLRTLSAQLSDILVFDFLTNNWGRFRSKPARWGRANHLSDGRLTTLRTDTVFQTRSSKRVRGRFRWTSRFRRSTITALRLLERRQTAELLYPSPSALERKKFELFWSQRRRLLKRVDRLVAHHGRHAALPFD